MLQKISELLIELLDKTGILGVFFATFIESFFAPIPSEIVLLTAGFYASSSGGISTLLLLCIVASFGNFFGTLPFYMISRFGSEKYLPAFLKKFGPYLLLSEKDLKKTEKFFEKRGSITVFVARLIPGIRSLIAFPAGLAKMHFWKYTLFTLSGSFMWNLLLSSIGYWGYENKETFFQILEPISNIILGLLVFVALAYIIRVIYNIKKLRAVR
jgi:membrane protein DedA with SNARE-associated domain